MKASRIAIFIVTLLIFQPLFADEGVYFNFAPQFSKSYGTTSYIMDLKGLDSTGNFIQLKSELIFPLDFYMAGGEVGIGAYSLGKENWSIQCGFKTSVTDPSGLFEDHDWYTGETPVGYFNGKLGYTESDMEASQIIITVDAKKRFRGSVKSCLYVRGGYRYQKIKQKALNFNGWQIDIFGDPTFTRIYFGQEIHALDYEVSYKSANIGFVWDYYLSQQLLFGLNSAYMLTWVSDIDDHILRGKVSTADGTGHGFWGIFNIKYLPDMGFGKTKLFVDISGQLINIKADTKQIQEWYRDEGDVSAGERIINIPHEIKTTQYDFSLKIGLMF